MTPATLNFTIYRGITFDPLIFNVKDSSGTPINLTSWSVLAESRNGTGKRYDLQPTINNAAAGQITISLDATETAQFKTGDQPWDFILQQPGGAKLGPYIAGIITVKDTVTNA